MKFWFLVPCLFFCFLVLGGLRAQGADLSQTDITIPPIPGSNGSTPAAPGNDSEQVPAPPNGASSASAAPQVVPASQPVANAYGLAMDLYKQGKYQDALPLFRQAVSQKPGNFQVYYYLGSTLFKLGRLSDAVDAFTLSCQVKPDPQLQAYIGRLKATLAAQANQRPVIQDEVKKTVQAAVTQAATGYPQVGLRFEPEMTFINLTMFWADSNNRNYNASVSIVTDPGYTFTDSLPTAFIGYTAEPFVRVNAHLDIGVPLSYLQVGKVSDQVQGAVYGNSSITYDLSAMVGGLNLRVLLEDAPLQIFVSGGPRLASMLVNVTNNNDPLPAGPASGSFTSLSVGGQAKVGLDWEFADNFILSCSGGYCWLQSGHLTGNVTTGGQTTLSRLEFNPGPTNESLITTVAENGPDQQGMAPLILDLSGPTGSLSLSVLF